MDAKIQIMKRMENVLKGQAMFIKEDDTISTQEKSIQMDVILDFMRFLNDYDENVKVLNRHLMEKKQKERRVDDEQR